MPVLEAIFISPGRGQPMQRLTEVEAVAGQGLTGDRYALGTGYYSGRYDCEVTLIEAEAVEVIMQSGGPQVQQGEHRRNLVTRGLNLRSLEGQRLRIGSVLLEYHRPRPPCDYLQRITEPGMTRALGRGAGIGMRILESGLLREGMEIEAIEMPVRPRRLP